MSSLKELWEEHEKSRMPAGHRGIVVDGMNLTLIVSEIGGSVFAHLIGGRLGTHRKLTLEERVVSLKSALNQVQNDALPYFSRVIAMSEMVLRE